MILPQFAKPTKNVSATPNIPKIPSKNKFKLLKVLLFILIFFGALSFLSFIFFYLPAKSIISQISGIESQVNILKQKITDKDLAGTKTEVTTLKNQLTNIEKSYQSFSYLKYFPYLKDYYFDGQRFIAIGQESLSTGEILLTAIEPYQDFLGLKGAATSSAQNTEDRITFLTQSVESLIPHLDNIEAKIINIDTNLSEINIDKYPDTFKDFEVKTNFNKIKEIISEVRTLVTDGKPILTKTSWLLGKDKPRNYLLIFQNDGELRPSGGFWTAYASLKVDKGKVIPGSASNIYDLDDRLSSTTPAPRLIKSYHINVPYLNLRDSNLSPDFPTDAEIFLNGYQKAMGKNNKFDAVIALDTQVLVDLVGVLGKLDTRVGTFTIDPDKRCDGCPKIIYDLEWISGRPRNYIELNRKDFLAPVMQALLANAMGSEKTKIPLLAGAFFKNINQKHIMFYFTDPEIQSAAVKANIAGSISQNNDNIDYIHLNDANFASAKSNIFITQSIKHEISTKDNKIEHKLTVTYTNPSAASNCNLEKGDLCLNAPKYRNLFRFYVTPGSQLIKMTGSEVEPQVYEELGKQVFEGFYGDKYPLYAKSNSKVSLQYTTPINISSNYTLKLQKQPGTKAVDYQILLNGQEVESFKWVADKIIKLSLK